MFVWIAITGLTRAQNEKGSCWNILTFVTRNIILFKKSFCALVVIRKMCSKSLEKIYSSYYFYLQKFQFATPTWGTNIAHIKIVNRTFRKEDFQQNSSAFLSKEHHICSRHWLNWWVYPPGSKNNFPWRCN